MSNKHTLDELTNELYQLISNEDLDADMLQEASEGLLPRLSDALHEAG